MVIKTTRSASQKGPPKSFTSMEITKGEEVPVDETRDSLATAATKLSTGR